IQASFNRRASQARYIPKLKPSSAARDFTHQRPHISNPSATDIEFDHTMNELLRIIADEQHHAYPFIVRITRINRITERIESDLSILQNTALLSPEEMLHTLRWIFRKQRELASPGVPSDRTVIEWAGGWNISPEALEEFLDLVRTVRGRREQAVDILKAAIRAARRMLQQSWALRTLDVNAADDWGR
ncbi:hypothetical protein EDC01DRAFT_763111, partial [Geopyxis carbonaria]